MNIDETSNPTEIGNQQADMVQEELKPQQKPQEQRFAELREAKSRAERERDEALKLLQEYELRQQKESILPDEEDELQIAPDALAEGKHLSKVSKKIKKLEEQLKNYHQQSSQIGIESQLKSQYPDFDKVVNEQTLHALRTEYPQIAQTLNSSTDLYSKAVTAYTLVKKLGLKPEDLYQEDRERAQNNSNKPRPLASLSPQQGDSPLSNVNAFAKDYKLSEELRKQLHKEMVEAMQNY
jgi:hypothetical protein